MPKSEGGLTRWFNEKWVDLSRPKKGGGFEPCGRDDAKSGKYPKCVPAVRAARMTPEQIESAIRRKRMAESREKREGKKPIMVSTVEKENVPEDPELYARVKAAAKKKFDVYPSAYANGWLVAEYKRRGGKYRVEKGDFVGHPFRGNQWTGRGHRTVMGPENVEMQMATPISRLAKRHTIKKDWQSVNAVDPNKREKVAKAYSKMKDFDDSPEVKKSWDDAEVEIKKQFKQLTEKDGIKVEFVDKDPYSSFHDMSKQVNETGVLKVLKTEQTGGHPYWSNETNDMFRAVHDAYGHLGTGRGFDRHGEEAAYQAHKSMFPESAHAALATELRGQNQFLIQTGAFGDQKIGFLPVELQKQYALIEKVFMGSGMITADDDNSYSMGGSHHVSGGRHFAGSVSKEQPSSSDVHVDAEMGRVQVIRDKKRKLKQKRMLMEKALKDPKGGLTAEGRKHFNRTTGSNLKAGVKGKADTPEKMRRKGSFLTRFFTNPSGPMVNEKGEPTRLALSANAWGEPVPKNRSDAAKLAQKGRNLLERYENVKKEDVEKRGDKDGHPFRGNQHTKGKGGAKTGSKTKAKAPAKKAPAGKPPRKSLKGVPRPKAPTKRGEPQLKTRLTILDKKTAEKAKSVKAYMMTPAKKFKKANHRSYAIERVNQMTGGKARPKGMSKKYKMTKEEVIRMETVLGKIFAAGRQKYGI